MNASGVASSLTLSSAPALDVEFLGPLDFCTNATRDYLASTTNKVGFAEAHELYKWLCPPLILGSAISVVINAGLYFVGHRFTRNKSPVLVLSLNLASTDTLASLLMGVGLIFNAYLP